MMKTMSGERQRVMSDGRLRRDGYKGVSGWTCGDKTGRAGVDTYLAFSWRYLKDMRCRYGPEADWQ